MRPKKNCGFAFNLLAVYKELYQKSLTSSLTLNKAAVFIACFDPGQGRMLFYLYVIKLPRNVFVQLIKDFLFCGNCAQNSLLVLILTFI